MLQAPIRTERIPQQHIAEKSTAWVKGQERELRARPVTEKRSAGVCAAKAWSSLNPIRCLRSGNSYNSNLHLVIAYVLFTSVRPRTAPSPLQMHNTRSWSAEFSAVRCSALLPLLLNLLFLSSSRSRALCLAFPLVLCTDTCASMPRHDVVCKLHVSSAPRHPSANRVRPLKT
jgi:hypothetical protein